MAFFQLVLKARSLEKARQIYEDEKLRSMEISRGARPRYTLRQRFRRKKLRCKKRVKDFWGKFTLCPRDSWFHKKSVSLRTDGTFENYLLKSVFGFFGGMLLTYIFFVFFVLQLNFALSTATWLCSVIGVILTLGLAFYHRVRCIVFLLLPQFFSKRGRQALMAYAFILAFTGPVKNILHNIAVLSESLACGQEQLKEAVKTVVDLVKQPFYALRNAISKVIKTVKVVVKKIKETLIAIKRLVLSILRVITSVFQWLGSVVNMCNKKLGSPFDRCERVFEGAVADCKAKLGPFFGGACNLTYVVSAMCYAVKPLDFICMLVSYVADTIVDTVKSKVKKFTMHVKAMFYVKVKFSHSFHFETNQSKTTGEISRGIITEIRSRTDRFLSVFDWLSFLTVFFIFFMLVRVMHYRYKWLTRERFDNHYLTDDLRTIDLIRARQEKETVLPLNRREKNKYIPLTSITLIKVERIKLAKSAVFLGLTTLKLVIYIVVDYSLYWVLSTIRFHGSVQAKVQRPNVVSVHVSGDGYLAELDRSIVKAFTPHGKETEIDTLPCLPEPVPPDTDRYTQIASLIVFCWLMAVFEPYGLRLRHVVMCHYHPDRAKQRAAWLYNDIIRSRGSFLKFARRQLRRKFGMIDGEATEKVTLRERLGATCPFLNVLFPQKQNVCLLCGAVERTDKSHIKCSTPGCAGLFCMQCFADLQNLCTICRSPVEYGDLSDISEEKDSSDDQTPMRREKAAKQKLLTVEKKLEDTREAKDEQKEIRDRAVDEDQRVERKRKDEADQTERAIEDADKISDSSYDYTYQEASPSEIEPDKRKKPFRDVEAQKVRDDVTIQIFNEPFIDETTSSSESLASCFVVRARRKIRARLKKKSFVAARGEATYSSTSIADTESWPTEEVDEEEVIHIEVDGGSEELPPKDSKDKRKRGRINRIVGAVARIPWLGKGESVDKIIDKGLQTRRPSLVKKIASMLKGKQSVKPMQMYKRVRKSKGEKLYKISSSSSSSTSSTYDEAEESGVLIKKRDRSTDTGHSARKKISEIGPKDSYDDTCSKTYDSHKYQTENTNLRHPHEKKFVAKQLPRYLEPVSRETSFYEVDETEDSRVGTRCVRQVEYINTLSDTRTSAESRKADTFNITDDNTQCSCTSEVTYDSSANKNDRPFGMSTISEKSGDESESTSNSGTQDQAGQSSVTENTDETGSTDNGTEEEAAAKEYDSSLNEDSEDSTKGSDETTNIAKDAHGTTRKKYFRKAHDLGTTHKGKVTELRSIPKEPEVRDQPAGLEIYEVYAKQREKNKASNKTITGKEVGEKLKIDKATDVPDKSRGTQTKYRKRKSATESDPVKYTDTSEKYSKKHRKCFEKKKRRKRRYMEGHKGKRNNSGQKRSTSEKSILTDPDEPRFPEKRKRRYHHEEDREKSRRENKKTDYYSQERTHKEHRYWGPKKCETCRDSISLNAPREECTLAANATAKPPDYCPRNIEPSVDPYERGPSFRTYDRTPKYFRESQIEEPRGYECKVPQRRYEFPVLRKYLPMYQNPELIEELKEHDRIKLIRERERRKWRPSSSARTTDYSLSCSQQQNVESHSASAMCNASTSAATKSAEDALPYQKTDAYKNVMCEFRRRTLHLKDNTKCVETLPLISLSDRADNVKDVKQLFPTNDGNPRKFRTATRHAHATTNVSMSSQSTAETSKSFEQNPKRQQLEKCENTACSSSFYSDSLNAVSSACKCSYKMHKFGIPTSTNESTDNNESTQ